MKGSAPLNSTQSFIQLVASAGTMTSPPDFLNTGNLSPMSPTPIDGFFSISPFSMNTILQDTASLNRVFPSGSGVSLTHGKGFTAADNAASGFHYDTCFNTSVNVLSQPGLHSNRLQTKQESVAVPMETDKRMMPVNVGLHCGVDYTNPFFQSQLHQREQYHQQQHNFGKQHHHLQHHEQKQQKVGPQKHHHQQYQQQQQNFEKQQHHLQHNQQNQQKFGPQQHQHQHYQQQQQKFQQGHNWYSYQGPQHKHILQGKSLPNNKGIQQAQAKSESLEEKHTGIILLHKESLKQEHQHFPQAPNKLLQPFDKSPKLHECQGQQLYQNSNSSEQLDMPYKQKPKQPRALSPQLKLKAQPQNNPVGPPNEVQPKVDLQGQQGSKPLVKLPFKHELPCSGKQKQLEKHIQGLLTTNEQEAHQLLWPQEGSIDELSARIKTENRNMTANGDAEASGQLIGVTKEGHHESVKGKDWLPFLCHANKCLYAEGQCKNSHCSTAKLLLAHMAKCHNHECLYPQCLSLRTLFSCHQHCDDQQCPICTLFQQSTGQCNHSLNKVINFADDTLRSANTVDASASGPNICLMSQSRNSVDKEQSQEPPLKKAKIEHVSPCDIWKKVEPRQESVPDPNTTQVASQIQHQAGEQNEQSTTSMKQKGHELFKLETIPAKEDVSMNLQQSIAKRHDNSKKDVEAKYEQVQWECSLQVINAEPTVVTSSKVPVGLKKEKKQVNHESQRMTPHADSSTTVKSGKLKLKAISLIEIFTPEQIRDHIAGLRQLIDQSEVKVENNKYGKHELKENACQLCMAGNLNFEPPTIYCTSCGARIKRNATYYSAGVGLTKSYFCLRCYNRIQHDTIGLDGVTYLKEKLDKRKNDEETQEEWIRCCKCEAWQHQICALFNARRNETGPADYTCPNCCMVEIKRGERRPLHQTAILGAKDLPRTGLSDHIEQRLSRRLKQERRERARSLGKDYEEVPGAEALVVRVVSSVDKKVEVKPHFLEIVGHEDYPVEFPYRSKVLLLFQKIEGVEVCLLSMYVQEFGSECPHPNQRHVCLSYLDSVKYFRPDVKTVTGESLRTFVYHEILIGYLEFCKGRGFTSFYIWACPPLKGEDYIHYCHPETQKTPNCDKLRAWYHTMLSKATKENIVLEVTNFHDYFFTCSDECKAMGTSTCLPYFDGDYWPGAIEDMILQLKPELEDCRKQHKKLKAKRKTTNCISKTSLQSGLTNNLSKYILLMQKLGESTYAMKDDFFMAHMHHTCARCHQFILSGKRWLCNHYQCRNYQICGKCYDADKELDEEDRHPINSKEKHVLCPIEVTDIHTDINEDKNEIIESEFFDNRPAFLSLCQGNHYQFDTLRRAKHSSMMILYHLHNPTAPAFVSTCNVCNHDIETGQGWRCESCFDFDICNGCYQNDNGHPHKMIAHASIAEYNALNQEARQRRVRQLQMMLDLLAHASQCCCPHCDYTNCRKVKGLFRHGRQCKTRASGGCSHCKKMWYLLQLHGRACKESECRVPHCKDLKEHSRRLQQQMESRRRAAVMERMRQCAAEASTNLS